MDTWVMPVDGGEARRLVSPGYLADWSPDGEWIAFGGGRRIRADGSGVEQIVNGLGGNQSTRWSRDGTHVYFARGDDTTRDLWTVSVADGKERRLSALDGRRGFLPGYAPVGDGRYLYFTWAEEIGDIWVMDVVE